MKRLGGWEPTSVTEYQYDGEGRLIRSVTTVESEWDDDERASMLALHRCERMTCPGCGGWLPETLAHEAEDYTVDLPVRCARCTVLAIHSDHHAEDDKHVHALRWSAKLRR